MFASWISPSITAKWICFVVALHVNRFLKVANVKGVLDARDMFPEIIRAVRKVQPKAFIIENVRGLINRGLSNYLRTSSTNCDFP